MSRRRLSALIAAALVAGTPAWALSLYSDIPDGSGLQKAAEVLSAQNIMSGLTPTFFGGTDFLNRFALAEVASALLGNEYVPFRVVVYGDVPQGHPSLQAVIRVTTVGLMKADKGRFNGKVAVTRYELAEVLDRLLLQKSGTAPGRRAAPVQLRDVPASNPSALAVERVVNAWQLTNGYEDGTFRGARPVTRFEALEMVARAAALMDPRVREALGDAVIAIGPNVSPTPLPTAVPTPRPTVAPTARPTVAPTPLPSARPTTAPTPRPTVAPTPLPTVAPTPRPTATPSSRPTVLPSAAPSPASSVSERITVRQPGDDIPWMLPTTAPEPTPRPTATAGPTEPTPLPSAPALTHGGGLRSPFEGYIVATGAFALFDETLPTIVTFDPAIPAVPGQVPGQVLQDQPLALQTGTGAGGVSGQYWWGPIGAAFDFNAGAGYILSDAPIAGVPQTGAALPETQLTELVNLRLQALYRFTLSPGLELAVGPEGVARFSSASRTVQNSYWRGDQGLFGGGVAARLGWRIFDPLALEAYLGANYLYQDLRLAPLDRMGAGLGLGVRYDVWRSPFGPVVATLGYVGSVVAQPQTFAMQNVHGLRLGLGMTFAPAL